MEAKPGGSITVPAARFTQLSELQSYGGGAAEPRPKGETGKDLMTRPGRTADFSRELPGRVLDEQHLRRMTLGDQSLEREVLHVFARQITLMLKRIAHAEPAQAAAAAHTLKGSARGLGAWRVADAAERLEEAAAAAGNMSEAIVELEVASSEVRGAIEARLHDAGTESRPRNGHASIHPT